jgi:hypothetical protein
MSAMPLRAPARWTEPRSWQREALARRTAALTRLRLVRAPAQAETRAPFVLVCVLILAGALLGALLLNTAMAQTAFAMQERQVQLARLSERQQDLAQQVEMAASPNALAQRARAAGMVPAPPPAFIRLADGMIIGESMPAAAAP